MPMHRSHKLASLTVFVAAVMALTGCSSGASSGSTDLLSSVREAGVLRVANTQASPPWSFVDGESGVVGYDVDLARELAERLGVEEVEFIPGGFDTFIAGVKSNKFDIVISGQTITEERKKEVDFSQPYQVNGVGIFVAETNTTIKGADDVDGLTVAVAAGTTQEDQARKLFPNSEIKTYDNSTLALRDVVAGRADANLVSRFQGTFLAEKNNLAVKPVGEILGAEVNAMTFKKGEPEFQAAVNEALKAMIDDGTLSEISKKWLGGLDMAKELAKADASK